MKKYTFEDYREALIYAAPKAKESILVRAEQDKNISSDEFSHLCEIAAYLEPA